MIMIVLALVLALVASCLANQTAPGTATRPILTDNEASSYDKTNYLQGWTPPALSTSQADYTVGIGNYTTVQAAVNAAIKDGGTTRKYIKVSEGNYSEVVYIPNTKVPLTIYGAGSNASQTVIALNLSATLSASAYENLVGQFFTSGDPAYSIFSNCANKSAIGTSCSSVFWVKAPNVQIINLTIENLSAQKGTDQAVALQTAADQIQVHNSVLSSHQDTFYSGSGNTVQRSHVTSTTIEGDVDFVFGGSATVFEQCTFHARADRNDGAVVFAPDTYPNNTYGYLVIDSTITGDSAFASSKNVYLARSWDRAVSSASKYIAGTSPNGQLVIRETTIDDVINTSAPYTNATSGRAYKGDASDSRNLNDNSYNRFWEYANTGEGS